MDLQEFQKFFEEECKKNNLIFDKYKVTQLYNYMNLVLDWNNRVNLTAIKDEKEFIVKHYVDSLLIDNIISEGKNILDIGTGAGFPGIPLKIYNPEKEFTLIDSVNKKVTILNGIIEELKLEKIMALHIRAENLAKDLKYREKYDAVTTRAVSKMVTIVEYMLPFLRIGGKAVCMKGPNIEQELKDSKKAINVLGGEIEKIENFKIDDEFERNIVVIKKVDRTDKKYPRGQGKPVKEPIK